MPTSVPTTKVHAILFTLYNYEPLIEALRNYARNECDYLVFGYETCPTTQRPHLQGYLHWKNPRTYPNKEFRKTLPDVRDFIANGTADQNRQYCLKIRTGDVPNTKFEEFGTLPKQGARADWNLAFEQIRGGTDIYNVLEVQPHLAPCVRALERVRQLSLKPRYGPVTTIVLVGEPGTGKSRWAYDNYPDLYSKPSGAWWDGYTGQKTILLDDFYGDVEYSLLLKVCDRYPLQVPIKGGFINAQWDTIIITSNRHPDTWYHNQPDPTAFKRRINKLCVDSIPPNNADEEELSQASLSV